jgi:hypothetical protein
LIFDFGISVQISTAIYDLNVLESSGNKTCAVVVDPDCASDTAYIGRHATGDGFRQFAL